MHVGMTWSMGFLGLTRGGGSYFASGLGLRFGTEVRPGLSLDWETASFVSVDPATCGATTSAYQVCPYDPRLSTIPSMVVLQLATGPVLRYQHRRLYVDTGVLLDTLWMVAEVVAQTKLGGGLRFGMGAVIPGPGHRRRVIGGELRLERVGGVAAITGLATFELGR